MNPTEELKDRLDQLRELPDKPTAGIMDRAVCVKVELRRPGNTRQVGAKAQVSTVGDKAQVALIQDAVKEEKTKTVPLISAEIRTDLTMLRVSKYIMDAPEIKAIEQLDGQIRRFMMTKALPSIFQSGVYLVPDADVPEVDHVLTNYQRTRRSLVNAAAVVLPRIIQEAEGRLGDLFDLKQYLDEERFRAAYAMTFQYVSYGVSEKLKQISSALFQREQEKQVRQWQEASAQIQQALRAKCNELITHMLDRLTGTTKEGKKLSFKESTVGNVKEFLDSFTTRNITDDQELAQLVEQAKKVLDGVDPETLRKDESLRQHVAVGFEEIKKALEPMMTVKAARKFQLFEDLEPASPLEPQEVPATVAP